MSYVNNADQTSLRVWSLSPDSYVWSNSIDPDQTPQNTASDLGLQYLPNSQNILRTWNSLVIFFR